MFLIHRRWQNATFGAFFSIYQHNWVKVCCESIYSVGLLDVKINDWYCGYLIKAFEHYLMDNAYSWLMIKEFIYYFYLPFMSTSRTVSMIWFQNSISFLSSVNLPILDISQGDIAGKEFNYFFFLIMRMKYVYCRKYLTSINWIYYLFKITHKIIA